MEPIDVTIAVKVRVTNLEALRRYARQRYTACWGSDDNLDGNDVAKLVYEALIASNENPSPDAYGIEIGDWAKMGPWGHWLRGETT